MQPNDTVFVVRGPHAAKVGTIEQIAPKASARGAEEALVSFKGATADRAWIPTKHLRVEGAKP